MPALPLLLATAALAASFGDGDDALARTAAMHASRLAALEAELEALTARASASRQVAADEQRMLLEALLADADDRASLLDDGAVAGWDGRWFIASPDGTRRLSCFGFTQVRWTLNRRRAEPGVDGTTAGFTVQRARIFLDGRFDDATFRIRSTMGATGAARLDQAYVNLPVGDDWSLRAGQFSLPLFHDDWVAADKQLLVNQSAVNVVFTQGTSQGVQLTRAWDRVRTWVAFSDGLRSSNTEVLGPRKNADFAFTTRVEARLGDAPWSQFDDYTAFPGDERGVFLGLAAHVESDSALIGATGDDVAYFTGNVGVEGDGWNAYAMGVITYDDINTPKGEHATDYGWIVQGGAFLTEHLELVGRFDWIEGDDVRANADPFRSVAVGLNWYAIPRSHRLKVSTAVIWFLDATEGTIGRDGTAVGFLESGHDDQIAVQAQLQLAF